MSPRRFAWLLLQLGWSALALAWFALARRGRPLVFTHLADVDAAGKDHQMGPLVDALRARGQAPLEVVLAPLDRSWARALARTRRPCVTHAALLAAARLLALAPGFDRARARLALGAAFLALVRPSVLYLIDESGSGQMLLRAARRRGLLTIGVQHGDFQPANPWYERQAAARRAIEPADVLAVWSPWFRARLGAISDLYDERNTRVVGRMRYATHAGAPPLAGAEAPRASTHARSVLLISEARADFPCEVEPFLEVLRKAPDLRLCVRPHPGEAAGRWPAEERAADGLAPALASADVVVGVASSALLEALAAGRPALVLGARDPAGLVQSGALSGCPLPERLLDALDAARDPEDLARARRTVWEGAPADAVGALLALGEAATEPPKPGA